MVSSLKILGRPTSLKSQANTEIWSIWGSSVEVWSSGRAPSSSGRAPLKFSRLTKFYTVGEG